MIKILSFKFFQDYRKMKITKREILFLLSAGITGFLYIAILFLLRDIWKISPYVSVAAAYISAMCFYFLTNKLFVFKKADSQKKIHFKEILHFSILITFNFLVTVFLVWLVMKFTGEVYTGSVVAGIVTTLLAYFVFGRIFG